MKKFIMLTAILSQLFRGNAQKKATDPFPVYTGKDLGCLYTPAKTTFRIWAPSANEARLLLYENGESIDTVLELPMKRSVNGTWIFGSDMAGGKPAGKPGVFYAFQVLNGNKWSDPVPDPYVKVTGVNGKRGMIADLHATDPAGWAHDALPALNHPTDAVIYELQVRDATMSPTSQVTQAGKFIGLAESGRTNAAGLSTGLDHLKEMGVTHIHLLPFFDFNSIDESSEHPAYNWGYDPLNYNVPEGSFATYANDGRVRIREFKMLVRSFHERGLRVVMDVVYNHTASIEKSSFEQLVPGYYYRHTADGKLSNATACGNETASEKTMMRKFMLESLIYWVKEYHVDGFRFDLMGVHDIETMNIISKELNKIKPGILLYGEGWTAGSSPLPDSMRALKANVSKLNGIAVFSDDVRDGIKGSVFDGADRGFASGKPGMDQSIRFGIVAAGQHPQVDYSKVNYSKAPYTTNPGQVITYCECHDNNTLWDKLAISVKDADEATRKQMHLLSLSIVLTSQGIPFLHAGTEILRTKKGVENSYNSPDSINAIDWDLKTKHIDVVKYVQALIRMRKDHPAFRMRTAKDIAAHLHFNDEEPGLITYVLDGAAVGDRWKRILVVLNGDGKERNVSLPAGAWKCFIRDNAVQETPEIKRVPSAAPYTCSIYYLD